MGMAGAGHPWCMIPMYPLKNILFLRTLYYLTHRQTTQTTTRPTTRVITKKSKITMTKWGKMEFRTHGFYAEYCISPESSCK